MKLEPILDRVAILREKEKIEQSDGGILIPNAKDKQSNYGEVVGVGPGGFNMDGSRKEMSVVVGDRVFYTEDYYITEVSNNVVIIDEEGILAVVRD